MPRWPHLACCPDNFEDLADVLFVVGGQRMPAPSQFLAAASKMMQSLMCDSQTFSKEQPLVLDQQLEGFSEADLQTFLNHVYLNSEIASPAAADAVIKVADLFDASKLMEKAVTYLEEVPGGNMFATSDDVMHWLLLAERFKLASFLKRFANHAAIRYKDVCGDPRFKQLGAVALQAIIHGVHLLTELHPGLSHKQDPYCYCGANPADYQNGAAHEVGVSETHVRQWYMCKKTHQFGESDRSEDCTDRTVLCPGHQGSWSWNLQRHVWQLNGKPAAVTKVLPANILELAELIGRPSCCTSENLKGNRSPQW